MFSSSIQKKLTFLIVLLLIPTIILLYVAEHVVSDRLERIKTGKNGIELIEQVWKSAEMINLGKKIESVNFQAQLNHYLQNPSIDSNKKETILKHWETIKNEEKTSSNRLLASQRIIADLAKTSKSTALLSELSPDFAIITFDRLPEVAYRIEKLTRLGERLQNKDTLGQSDIMAFLVNAGQFKAVADYVSRHSRNTANEFKSINFEQMEALGSDYRKKNSGFQNAAVKTTRSIETHRLGSKVEIDKLLKAETAFDKTIHNYWNENNQIFSNWLNEKQSQLKSFYVIVLTSLIVFIIALAIITWFLRKSILNQAKQLELTLKETAQKNETLKEREKELIDERKKAQLGEKSKAEFLANMSHEIRTPMNGVMGMAELLAATDLDSKQKMFADVIVKSGASLLTIINDILDFSKIDAGQMELDTAPFHLTEAVEDVVTLLSAAAAEKNIEVILRIAPNLPKGVVGDVGRIRQIMTNIVGNAIKFTNEGHVYINIDGEIIPGNNGEAVALKFSIEDTGIGIEKDKLEQVFEKFSQVDGSATRKHEGTGLGLSIASSMVNLMGGKLGVQSELNQGTTFWFTIELPTHADIQQAKPIIDNLTDVRILIIDDNEVNRNILSEQMEVWKFDSASSSNGPEGLQIMHAVLANNLLLDLVILDYQMPEMNGAQVLEIMRNDPKLKNIPVLTLTSVDDAQTHQTLTKLGVEANLTKPARSSMLLETIQQIIRDNRSKTNYSDIEAQKPTVTDIVKVSPKTVQKPKPISQKLNILVAEDNEVNQIVFEQVLEDLDFNFQIVENGKLAFNTFIIKQPDIILMDVSMPIMNGKEATKAIRKFETENNLTRIPIIGVTAHSLKGDRESCLDSGMDDYLSKPVSPDALKDKIHQWIDQAASNHHQNAQS